MVIGPAPERAARGAASTFLAPPAVPFIAGRRPRRPGTARRGILGVAIMMMVAAPVEAFDQVLPTVPRGANTLVMIDVDRLFNSPMAQREGWREAHESSFAARPLMVPPGSRRAVLGSRIDMETMEPIWKSASVELDHLPDIAEIAARRGGQFDTIDGQPAARFPLDVIALHLKQQVIGILYPANRQRAALFARGARRGENGPRGYLAQAARLFDDRTTMLVAMNLEDVASPSEILPMVTAWLNEQNVEANPDAVSELLAGIRGITLKLIVEEQAMAAVGVHFRSDAVIISRFARPLFRTMLADLGADLDDISGWNVAVKGSTLTVGGGMSTSGLRRLFTVVELPSVTAGKAPSGQTAGSEELPPGKADPSLRYFRRITTLLDDLRGGRAGGNMARIAVWVARYADKIENLSTEDVDPDLRRFGAEVAAALHEIASVAQGAADGTAAHATRQRVPRQMQRNSFYVGRTDEGRRNREEFWQEHHARRRMAENMDIANQEIQAQRQAVAARQVSHAQFLVTQIDAATEQIRKEMTERFGIEF